MTENTVGESSQSPALKKKNPSFYCIIHHSEAIYYEITVLWQLCVHFRAEWYMYSFIIEYCSSI